MAKGGKLTKLMKKLSFGKTTTRPNTALPDSTTVSATSDDNKAGLHPVYVGKSRRQYLLTSTVVAHPAFRQLAGKSPTGTGDEITVGCEVVLFEHLLWMLENADPQPESLDELVDFYAC